MRPQNHTSLNPTLHLGFLLQKQEMSYCQVRLRWGSCFLVLRAEVSWTDTQVLSHLSLIPTLRIRCALSIFQMGEVNPREIKLYARDHTASRWQSWDPQPIWPIPRPWVLDCSPPCRPPSQERSPGLSWVRSHRTSGSGVTRDLHKRSTCSPKTPKYQMLK